MNYSTKPRHARQAQKRECILHISMAPYIGITSDHHKNRHKVSIAYSDAIIQAGGVPVILPPISGMESHYISLCDGFVFSGGGDPQMEHWGIATHKNATPVSAKRQEFELGLLEKLQTRPDIPVFGVCLGMQWMGLLAGGSLDQDLQLPMAKTHKDFIHSIVGDIGKGTVHSNHHQALTDAGSLSVVARAEDDVIEAIQDHARAWYVGVQWHPEKTEYEFLGQNLFNQFVQATT